MSASKHQRERLPCPECGSTHIECRDSRVMNSTTQLRRYACCKCKASFNIESVTSVIKSKDGKSLTKTIVTKYTKHRHVHVPRDRTHVIVEKPDGGSSVLMANMRMWRRTP
jgi:transposase-like protein